MNGHGKSDSLIVLGKRPNKGCGHLQSAEDVEGRKLAKGNLIQRTRSRTQGREILQHELNRIRQLANKDKQLRFTALWHHVYNIDLLREAYYNLKRRATPGIDGKTWWDYGEDLENNLQELSYRLRLGAYRAKPANRGYIAKSDGRRRPIGVLVVEDKIVQRAVADVLKAIYEADFLGFSYGFRPGRSTHDALDALAIAITRRKVNWVLDTDIRGFFDAIDHGWLIRFIEHRIADQRIVRHIKKWINAGVMEDGELRQMKEGTPQGGSVSPLLANIYLHYAFDLWAHWWRQKQAQGDVIIVRYADDIVTGFQYRRDAERFRNDLGKRLRKFKLELHVDKTRLIEFGRFANVDRKMRGVGKAETFNFLGFVHISSYTQKGRYIVLRQTVRKNMRKKLKEIKQELHGRMHDPIPEVGKWLKSVVDGHFRYFGVPGNLPALSKFRYQVIKYWHKTLCRRSQRSCHTWERMVRLANRWLPKARILHPYPEWRMGVRT